MKQRAKRWAFLSISTTFWITWHRAWPNSLPLIPFYFFPFLIFHVGLFWLNINVWYVLQWNEGALQFVTYYYKSVLWIRNKRLQYANERLDAKLLFPKRSCGNLSVHWFFFSHLSSRIYKRSCLSDCRSIPSVFCISCFCSNHENWLFSNSVGEPSKFYCQLMKNSRKSANTMPHSFIHSFIHSSIYQ